MVSSDPELTKPGRGGLRAAPSACLLRTPTQGTTVVTVLVSLAAAVYGLLFGSFASVPIHRWPGGGTVMEPTRSACPHCDTQIRARDNIPVVSWVLLRGRCRACDAPIHWRYPTLELATGLLFGAVTFVEGVTWLLPALLVLTWSMVVATAIDLEHQIIPNRLTYRLYPVLLVLVTVAAWQQDAWDAWLRGVIASIAIPLAMFLFSEAFRLLRGKQGMGMGDVKYAFSLGLVLGYLSGYHLVIFFYGTVISAAVVAFTLIASGRAKMATRIPYGPYLCLGTLVAVLFGEPLTEWIRDYLGFS